MISASRGSLRPPQWRKVVFAAGIGLGASAPSLAQADRHTPIAAPVSGTYDPRGGGDIVVTAQFREQRLQDTPIAITVVNAEMLEARSQTNLSQVADQTPNVQIKPQGTSYGPSISASIRGIGQADFNPAYEPGVGLYIDDVYYPQLTGALFDLLDLDRVEILRGPQGTLAGRNSIGGSIKMYSMKPDGTGGAYVEGTFGSRDRIGIRGSADFAVTPDLYGRLSGVFKRQEGYVKRVDFGCAHPVGSDPLNPAPGIAALRPAGRCAYRDKLGGVGYSAVRGVLRYAPSSGFEASIVADYTQDEHTVAGDVLLDANLDNSATNPVPGIPFDSRFICGRYCNYMTTEQPGGIFPGLLGNFPLVPTSGTDKSKYDGWGISGALRFDLTDVLSLQSITGYRHFTASFDADDDLSPANIAFGQNALGHWNFSQELRLHAKLADAIDATVGGYYFRQTTKYWAFQDIRYVGVNIGPVTLPLFPLQFLQPDKTDAGSKAAFAHAAWEVTTGLNLSGGLRYTAERKTYHYARLNPDGSINALQDPVGALYGQGYSGPDALDFNGNGDRSEMVAALSGSANRYQGHRLDWRVSADYRLSPDLMIYGNVSTGFKGGGTNPRPFNFRQLISFGPETLTAYEMGFKSDLLDQTLRLNVAAFYNRYKDIQLRVFSCPDSPCAAQLNAGNGVSRGVEAELSWRPVRNAQIDGSLSYLGFHYTSINPAAAYPANPSGIAEDDPSAAPKWKWSIGGQYRIALGDRAGDLTPRIDLSYQDALFNGGWIVNGSRIRTFIPSYVLANARLTWRSPNEDIRVSLEMTNLFDKYYLYNVFDLRSAGAGVDKGQPGRPREWALTIRKAW